MHVIPQSWAHLHILVTVFPSVGLVFAIGFYIAAVALNNEVMKKLGLFVFVLLALLDIPTYLSGVHATEALSENPKISQALMSTHYGWGFASIVALALTGFTALITLMRFVRAERVSDNAVHLVLGLALVAMALTLFGGDTGWQISHHELRLDEATQHLDMATPQWWSHIHMILNHFPTVGYVFALSFFVIALATGNNALKLTSLAIFVMCAILTVPTYVTGAASMWSLTAPQPQPGISRAVINAHRDLALWTLFAVAFTGGAAWIEIWRYRHLGRFSNTSLTLVLIFAVVTLGIMAETGHRGGQINHPEIHVPTDVLPTDPTAGVSPALERLINNVIWFVPWQTIHFFGFCLIFGTALAVVLRVFGFWKSVPFSAVHRLLPLGFLGVMMNVFTGMLMMIADTYRYVVNDYTFAPKIFLIPLGAIAVLYFSLSEDLWKVKAGEDAPMAAKWVAAVVLLSWAGVIICGRLLPYV
jgi:uncharacterized membrane protein